MPDLRPQSAFYKLSQGNDGCGPASIHDLLHGHAGAKGTTDKVMLVQRVSLMRTRRVVQGQPQHQAARARRARAAAAAA